MSPREAEERSRPVEENRGTPRDTEYPCGRERPVEVWNRLVIILAAKLVTQCTDLALKCIDLTVSAKDHA